MIRRISIFRIFWPEVCPFCGKASRKGICPVCRKKLDRLTIREPRCMKCGKPLRDSRQEYCRDCEHIYHYYDRGISLWLHREPVSLSVYRFKFHNQRAFGAYYAEEISRVLGDMIRTWKPDALVPVPLHPGKRRKRGYNQAAVLAEQVGLRLGIPVEETVLKRIRKTGPQKDLDPMQRRMNLEGAFAVCSGKRGWGPSGKIILLIDDIYTTGSTIDACAKVLRQAGAQKIYYLTISVGQGA